MSDGIFRERLSFSGSTTKTISVPADSFASVVYVDGSATAQRKATVSIGSTVAWVGYFKDTPFRQNLGSNGIGSRVKGQDISIICDGVAEIFIGYKLYN